MGERKSKMSVMKHDDQAAQSTSTENDDTLSLLETAQSVLWAMLGVQKEKNAKRDFRKGKASHFIIIGITFGLVFILSLAAIVNFILTTVTTSS